MPDCLLTTTSTMQGNKYSPGQKMHLFKNLKCYDYIYKIWLLGHILSHPQKQLL